MSRPIFLSAQWRYLCLFNFEIEPTILHPYLPFGTELDFHNGKTYVSVVGFLFERTCLLGVIPAVGHRTFEEVNLRFYVLRKEANEVKRGVVFVKEIVPKPLLASIARTFYRENYIAMRMGHAIETPVERRAHARRVSYWWGTKGNAAFENRMSVELSDRSMSERVESEARWISEHYWGYTRVSEGLTYEYEVRHPPWRLWNAAGHELEIDAVSLYGAAFAGTLRQAPASVFVAEGSAITVHLPRGIRCIAPAGTATGGLGG